MNATFLDIKAIPSKAGSKRGLAWPDGLAIALLVLLPTCLAIFNDNWVFTGTQVAWIDPWLYVSYFLHLKAQLLAFPSAYYGDRLSDILPGWAIYHLFGPWIGNYVFKLAVIYTALCGLYLTISHLFGRRVALASGLLLCAQPYFLAAFGWDYVDGIGIAYCSLAMLYALRGAQSERYKVSLFLAGFFCNCLITSHFLWLNLVWIIPLGYLIANQLGSKHSILTSTAMLVLGFMTAFALFCSIYYGLTGRWFYLANNLSHTLTGFGAAQNVNAPLSSWFSSSIWMTQYNAMILLALWLMLRKGAPREERFCLLLFVTAYVTVWAWQAVRFPFVMLSFYTSFLFPFYALALAVVCNHLLKHLSDRAYRVGIACCLALGFILYLAGTNASPSRLLLSFSRDWITTHKMIALSLILFLTTVPIFISNLGRPTALAIFLTGILIVYGGQLALGANRWFGLGGEFTNKQGFRVVLDADAWVSQRQPDRKLLWWSDQQEKWQGIIAGATSLYLWGWSVLSLKLPELSPQDAEKLGINPTVLVLSWDARNLDKARDTLATHGFSVRTQEVTTIRNSALALNLALFHVRKTKPSMDEFVAHEGLREIPTDIQVSQILSTPSDSSFENDRFCHLTARAPRWAYLAYLPLHFRGNPREVWIRLTATVAKGQIGFGVLNGNETDFYDRQFLNADPESQEVLLDVAHPSDSRKLIIENGDWGEKESEVTVQKITVLVRPDSAASTPAPPNQADRRGKTNASSR